MKIINLFGSPSAGKSTTMLGLTYYMKLLGLSVENTPEYFKELVQSNIVSKKKDDEPVKSKFGGQLFVLAEQNRRLEVLEGKNDFAVTDCPLPLVDFYTPQDYIPGFSKMANALYNKYDNINYFIVRNHAFEKDKRIHSEEESDSLSPKLLEYLSQNNIEIKIIKSGEDLVQRIIADLVESKIIILPKQKKIITP